MFQASFIIAIFLLGEPDMGLGVLLVSLLRGGGGGHLMVVIAGGDEGFSLLLNFISEVGSLRECNLSC